LLRSPACRRPLPPRCSTASQACASTSCSRVRINSLFSTKLLPSSTRFRIHARESSARKFAQNFFSFL
jgi:hypothetical protein